MAAKKNVRSGEVLDSKAQLANASAVAVSRIPENPMPVSHGAPQVQLDLRVTTQDLVDIAMGDKSEELTLEKDKVERELSAEMQKHAKLQERLGQQAEKLVADSGISQEVRDLATRLSDFTGNQHSVKLVSVDASTWRYERDKSKEDPEVNIKKQVIIGEIRIVKKDETIIASRKIELAFTDDMKQTVTDLAAQAVKIRDIEAQLMDVRRKIVDLPRFALRAKNDLTKAYLRGQLPDTKAMLDVVMATQVKALPSSVVG